MNTGTSVMVVCRLAVPQVSVYMVACGMAMTAVCGEAAFVIVVPEILHPPAGRLAPFQEKVTVVGVFFCTRDGDAEKTDMLGGVGTHGPPFGPMYPALQAQVGGLAVFGSEHVMGTHGPPLGPVYPISHEQVG